MSNMLQKKGTKKSKKQAEAESDSDEDEMDDSDSEDEEMEDAPAKPGMYRNIMVSTLDSILLSCNIIIIIIVANSIYICAYVN